MFGTGLNFDFSHLPSNYNADVQVFFSNQNTTAQWQQWTKPRGSTMCYMVCVAGAGGGGGGQTRATTVVGGGGGGGACGSVAISIMPILFLPDNLKVSVGLGGAGGAAGAAGAAGTNSYISFGAGISTGIVIPNIILGSGVNAPGGGAAGAAGAGGAGGTVPTIMTAAVLGQGGLWGIQKFTVGIVGAAGTAVAGTAVTTWALLPLSPGAGGAGIAVATANGNAGGAQTLTNAMDFADGSYGPAATYIPGGTAATGAGAAGNGNSGINNMKPFIQTGGSGGGSADLQIGGNGGNGGIGSGGGGGGCGTTGGNGGNGGNGIVVIISW